MTRRLAAPSGNPPPAEAILGGHAIDLLGLAREVCDRYRTEFPDERGRYGPAGAAWCLHDNQHILNWGVLAVEWEHDMNRDLEWLASVLAHRDFPVARLVRDLEIAADVVDARLGARGSGLGMRLRSGAEFVGELAEVSSAGTEVTAPPVRADRQR